MRFGDRRGRCGRGTRGLFSALMLVAALAQPAAAQQPLSGVVAVDQLRQLPASVAQVRAVIQGSSFGPFQISGSCKHGCVLWGMGCSVLSWSQAVSYVGDRGELDDRMRRVQALSAQFDDRFAPVKSWLLETLPQHERQFDASAVRLREIEESLGRPGLSAPAADALRQELSGVIDALDAALRAGAGQLQGALKDLAIFNAQLGAALREVEDERSGIEARIASDERHLNDELGGFACDADRARQWHAEVRAKVHAQLQDIAAAAQSFQVGATRTDAAISTLLGRLLSLVDAHRNVLDSLGAARITPLAAVQQLRLSVAVAGWKELAEQARRAFGGG